MGALKNSIEFFTPLSRAFILPKLYYNTKVRAEWDFLLKLWVSLAIFIKKIHDFFFFLKNQCKSKIMGKFMKILGTKIKRSLAVWWLMSDDPTKTQMTQCPFCLKFGAHAPTCAAVQKTQTIEGLERIRIKSVRAHHYQF